MNSFKFTDIGGCVTIFAENKTNFIEISVSDNGIGMAQATIDKLLQQSKIKSTTGTLCEQGTGFGFCLILEFTTMLRGKVLISSELGKGTCVSIRLPK